MTDAIAYEIGDMVMAAIAWTGCIATALVAAGFILGL